jgi:hypothetical protein
MTANLGAYANVIRRHRGQRRVIRAGPDSRPDDAADDTRPRRSLRLIVIEVATA